MSVTELALAVVQVAAAAGGAWIAVRVELRWLRADVTRHETRLDSHDTRVRALELKHE